MSNEVKSVVMMSTDYDMFVPCVFNRSIEVDEKHPMFKSMEEFGFIPEFPIVCEPMADGKLSIKCGHTRFAAAKLSKKPIYYLMSTCNVSIHKLEHATVAWSYKNFMESYARKGYYAYIILLEYCDRTGISLSQATSMFVGESASSGNWKERAKAGEFVIRDMKYAEMVGEVVVATREAGVEFACNQSYVAAVSNMCRLSEFDKDTYIKRMKRNTHLMSKQADSSQYLFLIEKIYNRGTSNKVFIAQKAKQAALDRQVTRSNGVRKTDKVKKLVGSSAAGIRS